MDLTVIQASDGRKGVIVLFWRWEVKVEPLYAEPNYIDVRIEEGDDKTWRFTGMYGEFRWEDKYKTWHMIRDLHGQHNLPWLIMGDMNEIFFSNEK